MVCPMTMVPLLFAIGVSAPTTGLHYSCAVITTNTVGQELRRRVIDGDIDFGATDEKWTQVFLTDDSGKPQPLPFMEGLHYDSRIKGTLTVPEPAKKLPELATEARDIVDDMVMFQEFAAYVDRVKPGVETDFGPGKGDAKGLNLNTKLSSLGSATIDGHHCKLIKYENFFCKMDLKFPGVHLVGRSHTWGEIWVDQRSHALVRATMREDLLGELTMGDAKNSTPLNVFREGTLKLR